MQYESVRISEGLRREELILQIADRLNLINSYSNSIFKSISERLNDVQHQLKDINHRSEICSKKIELLKSEKKAITLYSNPKFPKKPSRKSAEFIGTIRIDAEDLIRLKRFDKTHPIIESSHVPYDDDCKLKSQFYIYDDGSKKYHCMSGPISEYLTESDIPWQSMSSVSSLLLFNSSENAYSLYRSNFAKNDNPKVKKSKPAIEANETKEKEDKSNKEDDFRLTFHSKPDMIDDLPSELPSLSGIADELCFEESKSFKTSNQTKLDLTDLSNASETLPVSLTSSIASNKENNSVENLKFNPPPSNIPPPPPPPPPLLSLSPPICDKDKKIKAELRAETEKSLPPAEPNRANLLKSIRDAAGKPKKLSIKQKKHDEKLRKKDAEEQLNVEGISTSKLNNMEATDMMSELRKRLESRRSGISNVSNRSSNSSSKSKTKVEVSNSKKLSLDLGSIMANVSAMIPDPNNSTESDSDNNLNDDFDDWN
ncbi:hypothetical protein NH340_JMT00448 [Sarcoptes scabiei]|nr:hypothetical protein NH340_JMT00448 [Sarcoptes scabiei]